MKECSICGFDYDLSMCEKITVPVVEDHIDVYDRNIIWLCDECFDNFPADLCKVIRKSDPGSEVEILINPDSFPNRDTYCLFLECMIGSGDFRSRKGRKIYDVLCGISEKKHANRQLRMFITDDWKQDAIGLSDSVFTCSHTKDYIVYQRVDFDFLADIFWRGNKWGYAPNELRVCIYKYVGAEALTFIVGTNDYKIDNCLYAEFGDKSVQEKCKIMDEVLSFDDVDEAVKWLFRLHLYIRYNNVCTYFEDGRDRWSYMTMFVQNRRYECNTFYEWPDQRYVTRMIYENERI
jgi:hypothetical protein